MHVLLLPDSTMACSLDEVDVYLRFCILLLSVASSINSVLALHVSAVERPRTADQISELTCTHAQCAKKRHAG